MKTKQSIGFERTFIVMCSFLKAFFQTGWLRSFLSGKFENPVHQTGCLNFRRSLEFAPIVDLLPHLIRVQRVLESTRTKKAKENNSILVRAKKKGSDRKKCFIRGRMPVR
jgi:hypothetical protein